MSAPYRVIVEGEDLAAARMLAFGTKAVAGAKATDVKIAGKVAEDARAKAESIGGVAAYVAPSIGSHGDEIEFGAGLPMAMGAEFGRDAYAQFNRWTGTGETAGYFLIPTVVSEESTALAEHQAALELALRSS